MSSSGTSWIEKLTPSALLGILCGEFVFLVLLLIAYELDWLHVRVFPPVVADVMPLIVPWGGALGGVCIGFVGVTRHWSKWHSASGELSTAQAVRWNGWYLTRVPLGAALGTVAALMVVLFLGTVGLTDDARVDVSPLGAATLMVVAFVVGYKQETFRALLERVVDVVLGPGPSTATGDSFTLAATTVDFGAIAVNSELRKNVGVTNSGRRMLVVGKSQVTVAGAGFAVTQVPGLLPGGDTGQVEVTFRPTAAGTYSGTAVVTVGGVTRAVELTGTATV